MSLPISIENVFRHLDIIFKNQINLENEFCVLKNVNLELIFKSIRSEFFKHRLTCSV